MGQPPASSARGAAPSTARAGWAWARGLVPTSTVHRLAWAGLFVLTFAMSSILFVIFLTRGSSGRLERTSTLEAEAKLAEQNAAPAVGAAEAQPPPIPVKQAAPPAQPTPAPASSDFDAPSLDDAQLIELFALEDRKELPTCVDRLGDTGSRYTGSDPRQSVLQLKAARRELMRGKADDAHQFFCGATAHDPGNVAAQQGLAELLLQLGDPAQAKATAERALEHAPDDTEVIALRGDALALLGDLATSRELWLSTLPEKGSEQDRTRRLASSYRLLGDRALRASGFGNARSFYRRSVILTSGSFAPSIGLSEALLWLGHRRAALVWAQRTARAFPKDSRIQLLYGDALYDNERPDEARAAWQAAVDAQPGNVTAQRRLIEGRR
jgi:tetratricopeptide (TPR) repeat protein